MYLKESVMHKLGKRAISVSDIASQFWCEKQMELNYMYGKRYTEAMAMGSKIHGELEEVAHERLDAEPKTFTDSLYKSAYENYSVIRKLVEIGVGRELKIFGSINGYALSGQIDELLLKNGKITVVENKTTSSQGSPGYAYIKSHKVQVLLYVKMLDDIKSGKYSYDNFSASYNIAERKLSKEFSSRLNELGISTEKASIEDVFKRMFDSILQLPEISKSTELHYIDKVTHKQVYSIGIDYKEDEVRNMLVYSMKYWNGEREAKPVDEEEKWKCTSCRFFGKECKVWWS
ncbi:MAG: PD-(D/E)XK nuclease family protein [Candidatus Micrarchaeaceae archaeon]